MCCGGVWVGLNQRVANLQKVRVYLLLLAKAGSCSDSLCVTSSGCETRADAAVVL